MANIDINSSEPIIVYNPIFLHKLASLLGKTSRRVLGNYKNRARLRHILIYACCCCIFHNLTLLIKNFDIFFKKLFVHCLLFLVNYIQWNMIDKFLLYTTQEMRDIKFEMSLSSYNVSNFIPRYLFFFFFFYIFMISYREIILKITRDFKFLLLFFKS